MRSERVQRSQAFRKSIRRAELDDYFAKRRKQLIMADYEREMNEMKDSLKTSRQQEDYLTEMAIELAGDPKEEWLSSIRQLRRMMPVFNGDFHLWVSKSIISKICLTFKQEFKHLCLAAQSAKMLVDLLYITKANPNQSFVKSIMEYQFTIDVMALATDRMFSLADRLNFVILVVELAKTSINNYKCIVRDGIGSVMVDLCNQLRSAAFVETLNVILFLECLAQLLEKPENVKSSLMSQINSMSALCVNYIAQLVSQQSASWNILCAGMTALITILKLDRPAIYKELLATPFAVQRIVSLIANPDNSIAFKAVYVIAHLSYSDMQEIPGILISYNLFQSILTAYYEMQKGKYDIFHKGLLNIFSNFADSEVSEQVVGRKELAGIVMDGVASESLQVFKETIFYLSALFNTLHYNKLETFLANYDIIHAFSLRFNAEIADVGIHINLLNCCILLVERTKEVFHLSSDGPIIKSMQLNGLPELVENIKNNHKNKYLCAAADSFIEIFQSINFEKMMPL